MPSQYYCEYMYTYGGWKLTSQHVQPSYVCPGGFYADQFPLPGPHLIPPVYNGQSMFPEQPYFVDYDYADGKFTVREANVPEGFHAPEDPLAFAKRTGQLRIFPVAMKLDPAPRSTEDEQGGKSNRHLA